jgi:two-component system response regulator WspF
MGSGALDAVDTPVLGPAGELAGVGPLVDKIGLIAKLVAAPVTPPRIQPGSVASGPTRLLVVGASTGGPKALCDLLLPLPRDWNAAAVVVQHVDVAFAPGLASWLADRTGRPVRVAEHGQRPQPGEVLLAATNDHLVMATGGSLEYRPEPRDVFFRPSVDVFFESVAAHGPKSGVAVVLTGMGRDGARGLAALRHKGWHTIAQDEATSVVWSMPRAAIDAGAACEVLPVARMPAAITARM